jgi:hypothetical protein
VNGDGEVKEDHLGIVEQVWKKSIGKSALVGQMSTRTKQSLLVRYSAIIVLGLMRKNEPDLLASFQPYGGNTEYEDCRCDQIVSIACIIPIGISDLTLFFRYFPNLTRVVISTLIQDQSPGELQKYIERRSKKTVLFENHYSQTLPIDMSFIGSAPISSCHWFPGINTSKLKSLVIDAENVGQLVADALPYLKSLKICGYALPEERLLGVENLKVVLRESIEFTQQILDTFPNVKELAFFGDFDISIGKISLPEELKDLEFEGNVTNFDTLMDVVYDSHLVRLCPCRNGQEYRLYKPKLATSPTLKLNYQKGDNLKASRRNKIRSMTLVECLRKKGSADKRAETKVKKTLVK